MLVADVGSDHLGSYNFKASEDADRIFNSLHTCPRPVQTHQAAIFGVAQRTDGGELTKYCVQILLETVQP